MSLASAIRAAVGGRVNSPRLEEQKPEDLEEENKPEEVEGDDPAPADDTDDEEKPEEIEGDDTAPADEKKDGEFAKGRKAERSRMAAILGSSKADANPTLAAHLAFNTGMSAKQAVATLSASASAPGAPGLAGRMQGRVPALGNGGNKPSALTGDAALIAHAKAQAAARAKK